MVEAFLKKVVRSIGFDVVRLNKQRQLPADFEAIHTEIIEKAQPFTMTSPERLFGLIEAVRYVLRSNINGAFVECGVWKGGSMLAMAETLRRHNMQDRDLYLYDTFEGMSAPTPEDVSFDNRPAEKLLQADANKEKNLVWAYSTLDTVQKTMALSGYPQEKIHYIKGKVEETIPQTIPEEIALLRLDTDWYASTKHEMIHLFPRLKRGGVLILDDYGHWKGARKAVDEYIAEQNIQILLNRLDETGRIAVKF